MHEKPPQENLPGSELELSGEDQRKLIVKAMQTIIESQPFADRKKINLKDFSVDHQLGIEALRTQLRQMGINYHSEFDFYDMVDMYNEAMGNLSGITRRAVSAIKRNIQKKDENEA